MKYHKNIIIAGLVALALTGCGKADTASAENRESLEKTDTEETETIQETQEQLPEFQKREFTIEDPEYDLYTREGQQELYRDRIEFQELSDKPNDISDADTWFQENDLFLPMIKNFLSDTTRIQWEEAAPEQAKWIYEDMAESVSRGFYDDRYFYEVVDTGRKGADLGSLDLYMYRLDSRELEITLHLGDFLYTDGYEPAADAEYDFIRQSVFWAQSEGDTLYLAIGHNTYAEDCPHTGYLLAIDLQNGEVLWESRQQAANANNFVLLEDVIVTGYGFTDEYDYLHVIDKGIGIDQKCVELKSAPDFLVEKDGKLYVHTYNTDYVFRIRRQSELERDTQAVKAELENLPDSLEELSETYDVCCLDYNNAIVGDLGMGYLASFLRTVEIGELGKLILAGTTVEGDAILTYISYNGKDFYVMQDNSRDKFRGTGEAYTEEICDASRVKEMIGEVQGMTRNREFTKEEQAQIEFFAKNRQQWRFDLETYGPYGLQYAVYDLDGDGRLELMTTVCMGTGLFSENHFYRMSEDGKTLETLNQRELPGQENQDFPDLDGYDMNWSMDAYRDSRGRVYYSGSNISRNGAAFHGVIQGFFYLEGDMVTFQDICHSTSEAASNNVDTIDTYYDMDDNEITKEAYDLLLSDFVKGMEQGKAYINWFPDSDVTKDTDDVWEQRLAQSYRYGLYY